MTYSGFPQLWPDRIAIHTLVIPHDVQNMAEKTGDLARSRTDQEVGGPLPRMLILEYGGGGKSGEMRGLLTAP